jgi:hypothetical protein
VEIDEATSVAAADVDEAVLVGDAADRIPKDWPARYFVDDYLKNIRGSGVT